LFKKAFTVRARVHSFCAREAQPREKPLGDVGIDVGLNSYAVLSDGARIENPRLYRKSEKRLVQEGERGL
jgi:putative transposase